MEWFYVVFMPVTTVWMPRIDALYGCPYGASTARVRLTRARDPRIPIPDRRIGGQRPATRPSRGSYQRAHLRRPQVEPLRLSKSAECGLLLPKLGLYLNRRRLLRSRFSAVLNVLWSDFCISGFRFSLFTAISESELTAIWLF